MRTPETPELRPIEHVSPSLYETLLGCPARAAWYAHGQRGALAPHPLALLGTCFHAVMEALQRGEFPQNAEQRQAAARDCFDSAASGLLANTHPLLKVKFPSPEKLPFYNLFRERAATLAADHPGGVKTDVPPTDEQRALAEHRFTSSDGLIVGRPDLINIPGREVVDYKTGLAGDEAWRVSDREARQLNLYAYLAGEAGFDVSRGTIVRGDGQTATVEIAAEAAAAEADKARVALAEFNERLDGRTFDDMARPAPDVCRMCPCIPVCEAFWQASDPTWQPECGVHLEATVVGVDHATVQGVPLVSLLVEGSRGTVGQGEVTIEQVPVAWVTADGDRAPEPGDVIRLVEGRVANPEEPVVLRADRIMTSLWNIGGNGG